MKTLKIIFMMLAMLCAAAVYGQDSVLTIERCHDLAVSYNKGLRQASLQRDAIGYTHRAASTLYLPRVSATGMYMRTGDEFSLLSDEQKQTLPQMGTALSMPELNAVGQGLVDALRTDTRNMASAAVILTQPIYMGGKIRAYNNITRLAEEVALHKCDAELQDLIVKVDETYWNIVALTARKSLAESYLRLVQTLNDDVEQMIAQGVACQADGLSVRVKVNEANVAIIQINNGIEILKMALCELCGLPITADFRLADEGVDDPQFADAYTLGDYDMAWQNRPELRALNLAARIGDEQVRLARSELLPTVALTGGYFASYPSVFNSFEKKFKGTWFVGVAVNVPILTWGERSFKVRAAQAQAASAQIRYEEMCEAVELQVHQCRRRLTEAQERLTASLSSQEEANENLRIANLGMRQGVIPVSNVIEAQTAWLGARSNLISAYIDVHLAHIYLQKSLGIIQQ